MGILPDGTDDGQGGILGPGWQSDPNLNNGTPYRQITSPQDQNWSDLQGNPIHMGGPPPAYIPQTTFGGYNAVFDPRAPSADGGWFTMQDYLAGGNQGAEEGKWNAPQNPRVGGANYNSLSTNNWRLLPENYRTPDYFMINGTIVSRAQMGRDLAPKSVLGTEGTGFPGYSFLGGGMWATPFGSQGSMNGYIGSNGGWNINSTPTY